MRVGRAEGGHLRRDIPAPYISNKENSFNDPSHDTVLHHKAVPVIHRKAAAPMQATLKEMGPKGFAVELSTKHQGTLTDTTVFPCGAFRRFGKFGFDGLTYSVPAAKGRIFMFSSFLWSPQHQFQQPAGQHGVASFLGGLMAQRRWQGHLVTHDLVDADNAIQYSVDRNRSRSPKMFLPAAADRGPAAFLFWMQKYGGGGPPVSTLQQPIDLSQPAVPRRVLLDRYEQHTKYCKDCREAHAFFSALASVALAAAMVLAAAAVASLAVQGLSLAGGLLGAGAAAAAALHLKLARLVQRFVFVDYDARHVSKQA